MLQQKEHQSTAIAMEVTDPFILLNRFLSMLVAIQASRHDEPEASGREGPLAKRIREFFGKLK